jgi:hypothetical protein
MQSRADWHWPKAISRTLVSLALASAALFASADARSDVVDECIEDSRSAQVLRRDGKIVEASARFERCARATCPPIIRADCGKGVEETRSVMPTVVLSAVDASGHDLVDPRVIVDGVVVLDRPNGLETALDPGTHQIEFTRPNGQRVALEVLVKAGEKARPIVGRFAPPTAAPAAATATRADESTRIAERPSVVLPMALYGVAALATAGAIYLQLSGTADVREVRDRCGNDCPRDELDELDDRRTAKEWAARGALGAAIIAAGVATILLVTGGASTRASSSLRSPFVVRF